MLDYAALHLSEERLARLGIFDGVQNTRTGSFMIGAGITSDMGVIGSVESGNGDTSAEVRLISIDDSFFERLGLDFNLNLQGELGAHPRSREELESLRRLLRSETNLRAKTEQGRAFNKLSNDDRIFFDLVAYCPGMTASLADIQAVLEAEAPPSPQSLPGTIDPAARKLFDNARSAGWQSLTVSGAKPHAGAVTITFDGPAGILMSVSCRPALRNVSSVTARHCCTSIPTSASALGAVSRFHRIDFARSVPWALPPVEDLVAGLI